MDQTTLTAISLIISSGVKLYAAHTNKPEGWIPGPQDWAEIELLSEKSAADYKREALAGILPLE
jgi:hypothetical protein